MTLRTLTITLLVACVPGAAAAQQADLDAASIEDLLKVEVTSVSKKEEQLFQASSAIYVLTSEDIRRAGATTIPEALRLVPGVSVAQIDSSHWAVTARGFNGLRSNKLLVLIDGRSVYTPLFSGVYWDTEALAMDDISRIEVIRGPGATLWGANAVNGVINIISKPAREAQGARAILGAGSLDAKTATFRYGGRLGDSGHFRAGMRYADRGETRVSGEDRDAADAWQTLQGSFRADVRLTPIDSLTVTADILRGESDRQFTLLTGVRSSIFSDRSATSHGRSLLARWAHSPSLRSEFSLQASYGGSRRRLLVSDEDYDVLDLEVQHRLPVGRSHDLVWGLGRKWSADRVPNGFMVAFTPDSHKGSLTDAFLQDEIQLVPSTLRLTIGSKFEHHDVSGFNVQPTVRFSWMPSPRRNVWGAVSRAVRTPSRADLGIRFNSDAFDAPTGQPVLVSVFGNPSFKPERVVAYEGGFRAAPSERLQFDTAIFYNRYEDLRHDVQSTYIEPDPAPAHLVLATRWENHSQAAAYGIEAMARWNVMPVWRIDGGYSSFRARFHDQHAGDSPNASTPAHQWQVGSRLELPRQMQLDSTLYWVDRIDAFDLPSYARLDARFRYLLRPGISVDLVAQNLFDGAHREFGDGDGVTATEVPRSANAKLTWRF